MTASDVNGYRLLAEAIIRKAAYDYLKNKGVCYLKGDDFKNTLGYSKSQGEIADCEKFFGSEYFRDITGGFNGMMILYNLNKFYKEWIKSGSDKVSDLLKCISINGTNA